MPKRRQLRAFDLKQIETVASLIGVDEVGRGAFAGPVVAAAVLVTRDFLDSRWAVTKSGRVNDSKVLNAEQREELWRVYLQYLFSATTWSNRYISLFLNTDSL